jgi:hypothetical protein
MLEADGSFCAHGDRRIEDLGARLINPDKLVEFALFPRREVQPIVRLVVALNTKGGVQK